MRVIFTLLLGLFNDFGYTRVNMNRSRFHYRRLLDSAVYYTEVLSIYYELNLHTKFIGETTHGPYTGRGPHGMSLTIFM